MLLSCFRRRETQAQHQSVENALKVASGNISHYTSRVPKEIKAKYIEIKEDKLLGALAYYRKYSQESSGYFEWSPGESKGFVVKQFSYDEVSNIMNMCFLMRMREQTNFCNMRFQLKPIFKEASGDLLLSLCKLLEVSWQVMIDDKISGWQAQQCISALDRPAYSSLVS